MYRGQRKRQPS